MPLLRNAVMKVGVSKALQLVGNCLNAAAQTTINNELLLISTKGIDDVQEILASICVYLRTNIPCIVRVVLELIAYSWCLNLESIGAGHYI